MKRLMSLLAVLFGAVAVGLVPAGPASADSGPHSVWIDGSMSITDEDWPDRDDHATVPFSGGMLLNATTPTKSLRFQGCADEVRVLLIVTATYNTSPFADGKVTIRTATWLYEGASCSTNDLEASAGRMFVVPQYTSGSDQWFINASGNNAGILLQVRNG